MRLTWSEMCDLMIETNVAWRSLGAWPISKMLWPIGSNPIAIA